MKQSNNQKIKKSKNQKNQIYQWQIVKTHNYDSISSKMHSAGAYSTVSCLFFYSQQISFLVPTPMEKIAPKYFYLSLPQIFEPPPKKTKSFLTTPQNADNQKTNVA